MFRFAIDPRLRDVLGLGDGHHHEHAEETDEAILGAAVADPHLDPHAGGQGEADGDDFQSPEVDSPMPPGNLDMGEGAAAEPL